MKIQEFLTLVDDTDRQYGKMEKLEVHQLGLLHRAFSVFIFNTNNELLLQQRADGKYHSAGLWTNTCCSHPQFGEDIVDAVNRRLEEEMGMAVDTEFAFSFIYRADFENGLTEHEFDHVFVGFSNQKPIPNQSEVKDWKYINLELLEKELMENPENYTAWLRICFPKVINHLEKHSVLVTN